MPKPGKVPQIEAFGPRRFELLFFISMFSMHYFSDVQTGRAILAALHWLVPWATHRALHLIHMGIRKMPHVTKFGVFSATVFRGARAGRVGWRIDWVIVTLVIAVQYASLRPTAPNVCFLCATPVHAMIHAIDTFAALQAQPIVCAYATRKWSFGAFEKNPQVPKSGSS